MKFGFLGCEPEWWLVQSAFAPGSADSLVALVVDASPAGSPRQSARPSWSHLPSSIRLLGEFDELLADSQLEAVILGGPVAARAERLRRLLQLGRHCLCLHPADLSPLVYHELAMIAADRRVVLMPWLPARLHPACLELATQFRSGSIGSVSVMTIERTGPLGFGRSLLAGAYAEAADVFCFIGGEVTEIASTGDLNAGRLVVHHRFAGQGVGELRLQSSPALSDRWEVTLESELGPTHLSLANGLDGPATLESPDGAEAYESAPGLPTRLLAEFRRAVCGQRSTLDWSDATRAAELADGAWYSLERRRAVDVFHEERGELASFKGRMTSIGCGLIWFTLFVLIVIAAGKGLQLPGMDWLAGATALIWLMFLTFQALRWMLPKNSSSDHNSGSASASALR